ncbi:MAG: mechanosensitive ion channel domain-containing protein, partial [Desulfobacterales bacterium]
MQFSFTDLAQMLEFSFWNNPLDAWLTALAVALGVMLLLRVLRWGLLRFFSRRASEQRWDLAELTATLASRSKLLFMSILAQYAGIRALTLPEKMLPWITSIAMAALILQVTLWANSAVDFFLNRSQSQNNGPDSAERITSLRAAALILKLIIAAIALLLILDNIPGVEITALVAGLGISGIAVALAVQNILSDLFASLSIVLDKPFVIGDFIIVDNYLGSIERIGLKTTRVRSLSGEQLIFANTDLLQSRLRNY